MDRFELTLQEGGESDADEIYRIHTSSIRQVCASHYGAKEIGVWAAKQTRETYVPSLKNKEILVAKEHSGTLVGFIHYIVHNSEKSCEDSDYELQKVHTEIKGLFVDPSFVRRGIGKLLLEKVVTLATDGGAECLTVSASLNSVAFYKEMGFREVETKAHEITCQCTVNCVCMIMPLGKRDT